MVYWFTGKANSGKTTLSKKLKLMLNVMGIKTLHLDADDIRNRIQDQDYSDKGRENHILRMVCIASIAEEQGFTVIVSCISPKKEWRNKAKNMIREFKLIYIDGGDLWKGITYEEPDESEQAIKILKNIPIRNIFLK